MKKFLFIVLPLILFVGALLAFNFIRKDPAYTPQNGDFIFQSLGKNKITEMIEGATNSPHSHCGIVIQKEGEWYVLEAISPVIETPLNDWIRRGRWSIFEVYRLQDQYLSSIPQIIAAGKTYLGKPYDIQYEWDDEKIYCSELIEKAFHQATGESLAPKTKLKDLNWKPYEALIREIDGGTLPLEREILTPVSLTQSSLLIKIY